MPNLVNNDTNPNPNLVNYYLNYVTPVVQGELLTWTSNGFDISALLTAAWGDDRKRWTKQSTGNQFWALRPPNIGVTGVNESLSADIVAPTSGALTTGARIMFGFFAGTGNLAANTTNGTTNYSISNFGSIPINSSTPYLFGVVNAQALMLVGFTTTGRTICNWHYMGWIRNPAFTGTQFPRNLVSLRGANNAISSTELTRVNTENLTTTQALYQTQDLGSAGIFNPAISCSVSTPGADTIEILLRDNASPYNYIGQPYFLIQGPSSLTVGKIYKNGAMGAGRDWEGSDNPYWMCICKPTNGRTILMRVWTEGVTN